MDELTKRCPFCDEEIRANAVKCKHCGSFLGDGTMRQTSVKQALTARYDVQEELGRGGMGVVYKAIQRNLNRPVALKVLPQQIVPDEEFLKRFHSEARKAAQISHPNIITIYDEGVENGVHFIAMEYIDGEDLRNVILKHGPLPIEKVLRWLTPVVEALGYAHHAGLIHRDIKSANILLSKTERPVLTDFGIARLAENAQATRVANDTSQLTRPGMILGTLQFMSPEQIAGMPASPLSDIYALGVVMYHCLTGELPFRGDTDWSTMQKITNVPPTSPRGIRADIPKAVENLVLKCMAKNPSQRFQNCEELAAALNALALELLPSSKKVETAPQMIGEAPAKNRKPIFVLAGLVVIAASIGFFFWQNENVRQKQIAQLWQRAETLSRAQQALLSEGNDAAQAWQEILQIAPQHEGARAQLDILRTNELARIAALRERGAQTEARAASQTLAQRFVADRQIQNLAEVLSLEERAQAAAQARNFITPEFDNVLELCNSMRAFEENNPIMLKLWHDTERWLAAEYRRNVNARNTARADELGRIGQENFPENDLWKHRVIAEGSTPPPRRETSNEASTPRVTDPLSAFNQYLNNYDFDAALHELTQLKSTDSNRNLEREAALLYERWGDYAMRRGQFDLAKEKFTIAFRADPNASGLKTKLRNAVWLEIEFVELTGGPFDMGDTFGEGEDDELRHQVYLSNFRISKHEITFAQFDAFCEATGRLKPSDNGWGRGRQPVINVSYHDAAAFCKWMSARVQKAVRLPTEAEWEYAARAAGRKIKWAGTDREADLANLAWYSVNSGNRTHLVGAKQPNALGLFDMNGNAFEWCRDVYDKDYYRRGNLNDPTGPNRGSRYVLRGGSILSSALDLRCANRHGARPEDTSTLTGFRIVY